jgi:hypothetical protein
MTTTAPTDQPALSRKIKEIIEEDFKLSYFIFLVLSCLCVIAFNIWMNAVAYTFLEYDPVLNCIPFFSLAVLTIMVWYLSSWCRREKAVRLHLHEQQSALALGAPLKMDRPHARKLAQDFEYDIQRRHGVTSVLSLPVPFASSSVINAPGTSFVGHQLQHPPGWKRSGYIAVPTSV